MIFFKKKKINFEDRENRIKIYNILYKYVRKLKESVYYMRKKNIMYYLRMILIRVFIFGK